MGRHSTSPYLFDEVKSISISFLKKHGYLLPNKWQSGTITWSRNGIKTSSVGISVNTTTNAAFLTFDYTCNETNYNYNVQIITKPSNIGNGLIWYFKCPVTGYLCRKLYFVNRKFLHRLCCKGYYYEKQTYSKKNRVLFKMYECLFAAESDKAPYFKTFYNGQPTKKYLKLINLAKYSSNITLEQLLIA